MVREKNMRYKPDITLSSHPLTFHDDLGYLKALVSCPELNSRASRFESSWMNVTLEGCELYIRKAGLGGDCHLVTVVLSSVCSYCHSSELLCLHDLHGGCFWLLFPSALKDTISQSLRWAFSYVSYILIFLDSFVFLSPFNIWFLRCLNSFKFSVFFQGNTCFQTLASCLVQFGCFSCLTEWFPETKLLRGPAQVHNSQAFCVCEAVTSSYCSHRPAFLVSSWSCLGALLVLPVTHKCFCWSSVELNHTRSCCE